MWRSWLWMVGLVVVPVCSEVAAISADEPWPRHTIDASSQGADGVRLADVDRDGRLDVVTGWEEGGVIRVCRHPGVDEVTKPWPSVTVGTVKSPEDAVFADVDRDGTPDVVSCCEGKTRSVFVHWAPKDRSRYWDDRAWTTATISAAADREAWMFCLPLQLGKETGTHLIVGSKGTGASISRLSPGANPRDPDGWSLERLCDAGWIMSLRSVDMDDDGDHDVLFSDRKGPTRGVAWLEQPEDPATGQWLKHVMGGTTEEVMFLDFGDLIGDSRNEVVAATRSAGVLVFSRGRSAGEWTEAMIPMHSGCGTGKGVRIADVNGDGHANLVVSCENSSNKHGVFWLSHQTEDVDKTWDFHPISGSREGIKFDRIELLDLDGDGDLDVMSCEERDNLGVIWYENPRGRSTFSATGIPK